MASEQVDCAVPLHWVDEIVGGTHDGGLPEDPRTPCMTSAEWAAAEQAAEDAADATDLDRMRSQRDEARGELQRLTASAADLASEWESRRDQHRRSPGGLLDRADAYDLCAEELRVLLAGDPR